MTTETNVFDPVQRRDAWVARVRRLLEQAAGWAQERGWKAETGSRQVREDHLGTYTIPTLRVYPPDGEVALEPVGAHVFGGTGEGRVDLEAYPTLNRVRLIAEAGDGWRIITDSNVPLRQPWNEQTFIQLTQDLLA